MAEKLLCPMELLAATESSGAQSERGMAQCQWWHPVTPWLRHLLGAPGIPSVSRAEQVRGFLLMYHARSAKC